MMANTEPSVDFRRANREPSVDLRKANTEPSVHFRKANTETYWKKNVNMSKRVGKDRVFLGLAGLPLWISLVICPRKTPSFPPLLLRLTHSLSKSRKASKSHQWFKGYGHLLKGFIFLIGGASGVEGAINGATPSSLIYLVLLS